MSDQNPTPQTAEENTDAEPKGFVERAVDKAKEIAEDVSEAIEDAAEDVSEAVSGAAKAVVEKAKDLAEDAKDLAEDAQEEITEVAGEAVELVETARQSVRHAVDMIRPGQAGVTLTSMDQAGDLSHPSGKLGYTGDVQGRSITLEELEAYEAEQKALDDADYLALLEQNLTTLNEGEIVTGKVVSLTEKEVVVDFGGKSNGIVSKNEFGRELELGEEVDLFLERLEDQRGQPMVSKTKADDARRWEQIIGAFEDGGVLEGTIVRRIKGGMIVNLLGAEAFLPGSQVDVRPVRDFDAYLNKTMEFKVVKINPGNGNVVVSHKALIEKDLLEQRRQILETMEPGQVLEGVVKNITNFGVFIDLGGVDGLLHITDLSWGRVGHPSEVVELDTKMNVVVLDYDKERQRISLGYKQLQPHPWDQIEEKYVEGMEVEGRVVSITDYGAFVELEKGIEGLVHISEMSWTEHVKHPTQKVQLGQMAKVKILRIDQEDKKISLGMKQLEPDPWEDIVARYPVGTTTKGKVRNLTTFGAFVEIEPGIDGLVHVSDLSWTKRVKHPSEVVRKGQDLDVQVLDIDIVKRRISLGHKQVQTDPWQQFQAAYAPGTDTTATIVDLNEGGAVVELPLDAQGFVPASQLEFSGSPTEGYRVGDQIDLRVIRLDQDNREVILSQTEKRRQAERAEQQAERAEQQAERREERRSVSEFQKKSSGPATIGELSGLAALKAQMEADEAAPAAASASSSKSGGSDEDQDDRDVILHEDDGAGSDDDAGSGNAEDVTKEPEFEGPNVDSVDDVKTLDMMDQPADEAVADAVEAQNDEEKEG